MPSIIQTSFSAGELSPTMFGRVDLAKYHVGLALMRNFFVDYRGGATSRPGTEFVARCKSEGARIFPFQFSSAQTYVLEFGSNYMRVHQNGAPVLEAGFAVSNVTLGTVTELELAGHNFAVGDWIFVSGIAGTTQLNTRTFIVFAIAGNTVTIRDLDNLNVDSTGYTAYSGGGTVSRVYTLETPYAESDLLLLKMVQSLDVITITHPNYRPRNLSRFGNTNWTLETIEFDNVLDPPTTVSASGPTAGTGETTAWFGYCVTAIDAETGEESIASVVADVECRNISAFQGAIKVTWDRVEGAAFYNVYKAQVSPTERVPIGVSFGFAGTAFGLEFIDGNIVPDFGKRPPLRRDPFAPGQITKVVPVLGGSGYGSTVGARPAITINDPTGTGAVIAPVVVGGVIQAYIVERGGKNYTNPTVVITGGGGTGAEATAEAGANSGTNPGVSCYFQQRRIYAASTNNPQTLWASRPGAFNNMDISIPTLPDDSLTLSLASAQVNDIKAMQPMPGGLVVLTSSGAWQVSGGGNNEPLSATSALATPQAYNGASDVQPIPINFEILYVQTKGSTVRSLSYDFFSNIYKGSDISVLSNHLFTGRTIREWAFSEEPFKIVWAIRDDGELLSLTFLKEQEVAGWAHSDTNGLFRSVTVIREGEEDVPYFIVRRYIQGAWVSYIEKMKSRHLAHNNVEDAWCLDCALALPQDKPAAEITLTDAAGIVTIDAMGSVFSAGSVGRVLRASGRVIDITQFVNASCVKGVARPQADEVVSDYTAPRPVAAGAWSITTPTSTISGLEHLEGETITVVGDGSVIGEFTVTNRTIQLPVTVSSIIAGMPYKCQLKTMPIDTGQPTAQGKRKKISALSLIVDKTRGIKVGHTFNELVEVKQWSRSVKLGSPLPLFSGQYRVIIDPNWREEGQICVEQSYPMPATILAVVPELIIGDTSK